MELWCVLKLATRCRGSGGSPVQAKVSCCCAQPEATQWKLQSDLWLVVAGARLGGTWGKLCCELWLVAAGTRLNTLCGHHGVGRGQPSIGLGSWPLS